MTPGHKFEQERLDKKLDNLNLVNYLNVLNFILFEPKREKNTFLLFKLLFGIGSNNSKEKKLTKF